MNTPLPRLSAIERARRVSVVLGPTNTGKTHFAVERMLEHRSGVIGLPLRLLAREVYNRIVEKVGPREVALITGEEKIKPRAPRYWVCTVEAMPRDLDVEFVAVDEVQLAADLDRGHLFTDRLLNRRGREDTLLIGASTARPAIERLLPGVAIATRPRLSKLSFAGAKKLSRLPPRSAIVAFSAEEVYAVAELIRRQRGGAAVVLGALSPRTRNAQVALYQNREVDFIVATDAIGMGLNLDVDHVAFASDKKFDGWTHRRLSPSEFGQIAGRAGRHLRDGTFGSTARCPGFDEELIEALEDHRFDPIGPLQWRNAELDFSSIDTLQRSLQAEPPFPGLTRAPLAQDELALDVASRDPDVLRQTKTRADAQRLWDACQLPDYRKLSPAAHADLVITLFSFIVRAGRVPDEWFRQNLSAFDRVDGDIDALSARIAQVRTFNYIANRPDWLRDPEHWQGVTRQVEDSLSDALHARLAHRFVDRRTSMLMRRLRENAMLEAEITSAGDVIVEGEHVGALHGFRFTADPQASGEAARALNAAAQKALVGEIEARAARVGDAVDQAFVLANDGAIRWLGEIVAKIAPGDHLLQPRARLVADERLSGAALETAQRRLDLWLTQHVKKLLGPLYELEAGEGLEGVARGIGFQLAESLGVLERSRVAQDTKSLDQNMRAALRKLGVRFGAYHLYLPLLLKPAPRALAAQLWALKNGGVEGVRGLDEVAHLASSGRTSFAADKDVIRPLYLAAGFRVSGERAVRVDILERLADLIRPAIAYRPGQTPGDPPPGAAEGDGFVVTVGMTSLAGCSGEAFASILRSLGYVSETRSGPAITSPLLARAPTEPAPAITAPARAAPVFTFDHDAAEGSIPPEEVGAVSLPAAAPEAAASEPLDAPALEAAIEAAPEPALPGLSVLGDEPSAAENEEAPAALETAQASVDDGESAAAEPEGEAPESQAPGETPSEETILAGDSSIEPSAPTGDESTSIGPEEAAGDSSEAAPAAPATIEVWRPGRRPSGERHHRGPRAERGGREQRERSGGERRWGRGPRPATDAPSQSPAAGSQAPESAPSPSGPPAGGRFEKRHGEHRPRPGAGGDRPERKPFKGRPERGDRPFASSERPARDRQPDPNSPFAKLAALKAAMEKPGKE